MNSRIWKAVSLSDLEMIAAEILEFATGYRMFLLHGQMGAGKTTLVKVFCELLGVKETVNSPTFSIVHEYEGRDGVLIYHFDLYRVKNQSELFDLGFEQYTDSDAFCFIEWPEKAEGLLIQPKADIFITSENEHRVIECRYE